MGYRLEGHCPDVQTIERTRDTGSGPTDIIEEGNAVGSIQVAGGQEVICLGRDCGTTGAYAKIGCLTSVDVSRMAQLRPGDTIRFLPVTVDEARASHQRSEAVLLAVVERSGAHAELTRELVDDPSGSTQSKHPGQAS
jgi:allophanate hydrolase subunit 2